MRFIPVAVAAFLLVIPTQTRSAVVFNFDSPPPALHPNLSLHAGTVTTLDPALMGGNASGRVGVTDAIRLRNHDPDIGEFEFPASSAAILSFDIRPAEDRDGDFRLFAITFMGERSVPIFVPYGRWTRVVGSFQTYPESETSNRHQSVTIATRYRDGKLFYVDNIRIGSPGENPLPEPATWAMLMLGFGAIGTALRRRNFLSHRERIRSLGAASA